MKKLNVKFVRDLTKFFDRCSLFFLENLLNTYIVQIYIISRVTRILFDENRIFSRHETQATQ